MSKKIMHNTVPEKIKISLAIASEDALPSAFVVYRDKLETSIKKAAKLGYDGVELALLNKEQADISSIKKLLHTYMLELPVISTGQMFAAGGVWFTADDPDIRRKAVGQFTGLMEIAAEFGSDINIGRLRGFIGKNQSRERAQQNFIDCLNPLADRAKELGIRIIIEPVNRYEINYINSCKEGVELLQQLNRPEVKLMPDVFHMNIEDVCISKTLEKYAEYIGYIHFADNTRLAPGQGHLDFPAIAAALKRVEYSGFIGVEILPEPDPDTAAKQAIEYLHSVLQ